MNLTLISNMTFHSKKVFRSLFMLLLGIIALGSVTASIVVDCRPQSGKPLNQTFCTGIIGGAGNNTITVEQGMSIKGPFFGDAVIGNGGDDTIINNGTTVSTGDGTGKNGDIEGDVATGNGGNDIIINNGTVAGDMDGDTVLGNGGNDTLINNGIVGDDMDGDNAQHNGGDDLIINNGTVGGDIEADDNTTAPNSRGGNDIIVVNGIVEGSVFGDFGVQFGGDDTVILQNGANGGSDHEMYIDGNDGNDTLVFNFTVNDHTAFDTLVAQIKDANPAEGSLTFNGQTFIWKNFEHLGNQLVEATQAATRILIFDQYTLAYVDYTAKASAAVYCMFGSLSLMGTDRQGKSEYLFTVKMDDVVTLMRQAVSSGKEVQIDVADGQSLWAQPSGELVAYDSYARYTLHFSPGESFCSRKPQTDGSVK